MAQHFIKTRIIKIAAVCCAFFVIAKSVSAQQLSTYEQKRYELTLKTLEQFKDYDESLGVAIGLLTAFKINADGNIGNDKLEEMYFAEGIIEALGDGSSYLGYDTFEEYSTKSAVKNIYRQWQEKRNVIDKTRTQADIARERKYKPIKGTVDYVILTIKQGFERWAKRGAYEKTIDYQTRLNTQGVAVFDSICDAVLSDGKLYFSSPAAKVTNEHYDPDKEQYLATVIYGDDTYKGKISVVCSISPDNARNYGVGTITKTRVDGKWLVPAESEYDNLWLVDSYGGYTKWERENRKTYYFKTIYTTTAKTSPLRIYFKDIKFSYNEISDELKNHCFSNDEYNAKLREYYDTLYYYKEDFRKRLDKLKSDYSTLNLSWFSDGFEEWFKRHSNYSVYGLNECDYNDVYWILNKEYKKAKCSYYTLREYESTLASIQAILDETEGEMEENLSNNETTKILDKLVNESASLPVISKVTIDGKRVSFVISKKEQVQGEFNSNKLKNTIGKPYKGNYDNSLCSNDEKLILYKTYTSYSNYYIILIVDNKKAYKLSPKVAQQLYTQGIY